jgi:hypothetical protein
MARDAAVGAVEAAVDPSTLACDDASRMVPVRAETPSA